MEKITHRDKEGGCFRGVYYFNEDLSLIEQMLDVKRQVEAAKSSLLARGDDPEAHLADIDRMLEDWIRKCRESAEADEAWLEKEVQVGQARKNLIIQLCRCYLFMRDGLEEHLQSLTPDQKSDYLEQFEEIKSVVRQLTFELPLADLADLRAIGWRDSDWEEA